MKIELKPKLPANIRSGVKTNVQPINLKRETTCLNCKINVEADRLYEVTFRMIVRDHELRAFKQTKFLEPREIYDPHDLIERQKELIKGTEIQVPEYLGKYMTQQDHEELKRKVGNTSGGSGPDQHEESMLDQTLASSKPKLKTLVVPFIIKQLYPMMNLADYSNMKEEKSFLNTTTFVCEDCFLCITMSSECSGVKIIVPPNPEKIIEAKKRELAIQARNTKKNTE